ncbi:hypothetical protein ACHWQZ_G011848 [Mnemiopsis leidyi]
MSESDSSDDELGLFSFANKKEIVSTPPASPSKSEIDESPIISDKSLFTRKSKRKRLDAPNIIDESGVLNEEESVNDISVISELDETNPISEKIRQYDSIVDNICNIDGVLNKLKSRIGSAEEDLPHSSYLVTDDSPSLLPDRPFMLKLRKGSNLHRFKIKMDTPLKTVLEHLGPEYDVSPELFILQLNDETLDWTKNPHQLGLTVVDIIEVLVGAVPQVAQKAQEEKNENIIKIKVQSTDLRNNTREYEVIKTKPLVESLFQATQDFGYEAAKFIFDGEPVLPRKTPIELELEEGDCFDIVEQT